MIASESGSELDEGYEWNYSATDHVKRVLGSYKDRSPGNLIMYFQAIGYRHVGTSPNLAKLWMLENMLNGAPLGFVVVGTLVNYEDRIFIPTLNELYGFHKTHEKLFTNLQSTANIALNKGSREEHEGLIKLLTEEHILYDIIEPSDLGTDRLPRPLDDYEAVLLGDVRSMDTPLLALLDRYVENGGKLLSTGFSSTCDGLGNPMNAIRLASLGVQPSYELFRQAKSTYLKVSEADKAALGPREMKDFSLVMMYSDFMKCRPAEATESYLRLLPHTRFGPPEKSYYTEENITDTPGVLSHVYGKGKSVLIPWLIGAQYLHKGHYAHRQLLVGALRHLLKVTQPLLTDASPLMEITRLGNRNGAFEWVGMINHSGQIGASFREPVPICHTTIRLKPLKPLKEIRLLRADISLEFKQTDGWIECTVPKVDDFEMIVLVY